MATVFVQRSYVDGQLHRTTKPTAIETLRKWLDNVERDWTKDGFWALAEPGQFDFNKAHTVTRVSLDELVIVTTGNKTLRFVNIERRVR